MDSVEHILVTGGSGYIGSHTSVELLQAGKKITVIDNLRNSSVQSLNRVREITGKELNFIELDMTDKAALEACFAKESFSAVIHFAGLKAVGESNAIPLDYFQNNVAATLNLLEVMGKHNCKNLVFSSSATVYGNPQTVPIDENFPTTSTNPYGRSKLMVEHILYDFSLANPDWNIARLRYFNPIGAHPSGLIGEDPQGVPNNLLPYVAQVAIGSREELPVFGDDYDTIDGTGVRDYIHVVDLAKGHLKALEKLKTGSGLITCNLGTGEGYSVLQVIQAFEKASGRSVNYKIYPRRQGDAETCYANPKLAETLLGWKAEFGLEEMCSHIWNWQKNNPKGFED